MNGEMDKELSFENFVWKTKFQEISNETFNKHFSL